MAAQVDVILGPSGSGKSAQADRLAVSRRYVHLSSGDLLRAKASPEVQADIRAGKLAPSNVTEALVEEVIAGIDPNLPILLDGFPRMNEQVDWLEEFLSKSGRKLQRVIFLNVPDGELALRLQKRQRNDDTPTASAERYKQFKKATMDVVKHYRKQHLLVEVDGVGTPEEVADRIAAAL